MRKLALSRRSFIQAAAGTAALSAMPDGLVAEAQAAQKQHAAARDGTKIVKTCCRACIHNCGVLVHVRNGRVVKIEGNPEYGMTRGSICPKGLTGIQALYNPNRNKYPMIRVGKRGENRWKRVSWKEAIDILARKLMETRRKYGAEAVMCTTGGGGNPAFRSIARFCNIFGTPNWYEPGCAQCYLPRTLAFGIQYGGPSTSIADEACLDIYNAKAPFKSLVFWGTDVSWSCPAGGGQATADMRARGVKTVCVDPRFVPEAQKADVWLPIRPGTDVALMMSWIKYILDHNLYDHEFVMKWTNLPYLVNTKTKMFLHGNDIEKGGNPKDYVVWDKKTKKARPLSYPWNNAYDVELDGEHTVNGVACKTGFRLLKERCASWTLEKAGKICFLDPKKIEEAIKIYVKGPGGISLGVATDQCPNSVEAAKGVVILNSIMGYVEKPGTLMQRFPTPGCAPANSLAPRATFMLPKGQLPKRLGSNEYKGLLQWSAGHVTSFLNAILTGKPYQPRVWIERSGNKMGVLANPQAWVPAFKKMDYMVHMYMYPTSFTNYCDMVLPVTEWLETNHIVECLNKIFARQEVVHLWETVDETLIWSKILLRCADLGHENCIKAKDPKIMGDELPLWNSMEELLDAKLKKRGLTWKKLLAHNPYTWMPFDKWSGYRVYERKNPKTGLPVGFHTPSGKLELYGEVYITLGRTGKPYADQPLPPASHDYDPLPFYMEPSESPLRAADKAYPLTMTNGRLPIFHHGTLRNTPWTRELYPVPEIWVNPVAAKKYGIKHGGWTWVESRRGKIRAVARVTEGIPPTTVYMERFWLPENLHKKTGGWQEVNVNCLSKNTAPFNEVVGTYTLRGYQVRISPAKSAPEGAWTKPEQFKVWLPQPSDPTKHPEF
ncbi:molybdopterin-dependent oxidoreductase [Mesosutterella sp. AGMB02718]|uniref:Molybdopterin-dependent oxidoreductase n=1 Tax=Mesosutterella faecium TaxID=2925194 RepID=A0ABT7IPB3_9BURK|nr:molybdopterin-dependent oxidoreductase [Mesosutterella sp. AGMB02718]MDL2060209.1 molybdopterin-dependent oxidoreductase [Mesosutterella sp. AGMB02718]